MVKHTLFDGNCVGIWSAEFPTLFHDKWNRVFTLQRYILKVIIRVDVLSIDVTWWWFCSLCFFFQRYASMMIVCVCVFILQDTGGDCVVFCWATLCLMVFVCVCFHYAVHHDGDCVGVLLSCTFMVIVCMCPLCGTPWWWLCRCFAELHFYGDCTYVFIIQCTMMMIVLVFCRAVLLGWLFVCVHFAEHYDGDM